MSQDEILEKVKKLRELTGVGFKDCKNAIDENNGDYKILLGQENRDMTITELLNGGYYQGRFASKNSKGDYVFNWSEDSL